MSAYVEGLKKGDIFNEYTLVEDFSPSANGFISHAKRNGEDFFIKAFARPKYPKNTHLMSEKIIQKKKERCQVFQKNFIDMVEVFKDNLNQKNGQLIYPVEFHRLDSTFHLETVPICALHHVFTWPPIYIGLLNLWRPWGCCSRWLFQQQIQVGLCDLELEPPLPPPIRQDIYLYSHHH